MITQGLLLLCAVALSEAYFKPLPPKPLPIFPIKPIVKPVIHKKFVPIVKKVKVPVYIQREVHVPVIIDREVHVPYPVKGGAGVGGGVGVGVGAGVGGGEGIDFGLNAQISDADHVNIQAGVGGVAGIQGIDNNGLNDFNGLNDLNNDGLIGGGAIDGGLVGFDSAPPASIDISQTSVSAPSASISQPQIDIGHGKIGGGHGDHGVHPKIAPATHHF